MTILTAILLSATAAAPQKTTLRVIDDPRIESLRWSVHGEVRHEGVEGEGYLELNNVLPSGTYFSRTLEAQGPMRKLTGTSDWRPFVLPFDATGGAPPTRLELNVFLPKGGSVEVRNVEVVDGSFERGGGGGWISAPMAGGVYGILGAIFGCLAGLLGWLSSRGAPRGIVMSLLAFLLAMCVADVAFALVAQLAGQPGYLVYPPLAGGVLGSALLVVLRRTIVARYRDLELRKMQSMDA
jgi:hypothetical protein